MGADLYITAIADQVRARYQPLFDEACARRDQLITLNGDARDPSRGVWDNNYAHPQVHAAQDDVLKYSELMSSEGYFRDSYNSSNLLWLFGLSYWEDFEGLINKKGEMSPTRARKLKRLLEEREPQFEKALAEYELENGETREAVEAYFRTKYADLRGFLNTAIDCKLPIYCSV